MVRANALVERNGEIVLDGGGAVQVAGTVEAIGGAINVSADSSLNVGSTVCCVPTQVTAGTQTIEAGSITVGGGASVTTTSGSQTVTTPGTLLVRGGVLSGGVGLFHNGSGEQRISAGNLELRGGTGTNTGAFINSNAGGDQVVTVTGALTITGGASGTGNRAGLVSTGAQTINGNPDIVLTGGSGGGSGNASNNVFIQATGPDTKPQTINARSIRLNAGTGTDASATLNAARQVINTIGDVSLVGGAGPGGSNGVRIGGIGGTHPRADQPHAQRRWESSAPWWQLERCEPWLKRRIDPSQHHHRQRSRQHYSGVGGRRCTHRQLEPGRRLRPATSR